MDVLISALLAVIFLLLVVVAAYVFLDWWLYAWRPTEVTMAEFVRGGRQRKGRVFVTGTDSGFGYDLVRKLDRLGVVVYAGCYTQEGARKLKAVTSVDNVRILDIDVTDDASVAKARKFIEDDLSADGISGLWGVVNNAGIATGLIFHYANMPNYQKVMDVNFFGVIRVTEAFLPLVLEARGRIVNIISILSRCSGISEPYICSKHALQPYNDGLRRYMATFGAYASAIEPGFFQTDLVNEKSLIADAEKSWAQLAPETRLMYGEKFHECVKATLERLNQSPPLANFNKLSMVVDAIVHGLFALRPRSRYIVGLDAHVVYRPMGLLPDWFSDFCCHIMLPFCGLLQRRVRMLRSEVDSKMKVH